MERLQCQLIFPRKLASLGTDRALIYTGSLEQCIDRRVVSGDLILDPDGRVRQEDDWLFDWEKTKPSCFARRAQRITENAS